jgi:hypothetical protein
MTTAPVHFSHASTTTPDKAGEWHDDRGYLATGSGRLACATLAFALLGAGFLAVFGTHDNTPMAIAVITLGCIMGGFVTTALSMERNGTLALAYLLTLPPIAGAYFAALHVLSGAGVALAVPMFALALIPLGLLARAKAAG